ncbi:MAG: hypothetical protein KDK53_19970 [Maritimibacter sp.]|nr:hypothetical protein [Maritimibacter sp.]
MFDMTKTGGDAAIIHFLLENADALANAAELLGGRAACSRTYRLLDDLRDTTGLTRRLHREIAALHRLLTLENVADPDRIECGYFAAIDPMDPAVEDICLLTTQFENVVNRVGTVPMPFAAGFSTAA